jgi:hypothetical protein
MTLDHVRAGRRTESGFVLIGVVMFIVVLTILAISLFTLAGFDSQFMNQSLDRNAAYNAAAGALDRARFALIAVDSLQAVRDSLPPGVDSTLAVQGDLGSGPSSGPIDWSGEDIWIRVRAHQRDETVVLMAAYRVSAMNDYYKRLFTAAGQFAAVNNIVDVTTVVGRRNSTILNGAVMQKVTMAADTAWNASPRTPGIRPPIEINNLIPLPDVGPYILSHRATASPPTFAGTTYTLTNLGSNPKYFYSTGNPQVHETNPPNPSPVVNVTGKCVWMVDPQMYFQEKVHITGAGVLIIVANTHFNPNVPSPNPGIWFQNGLVVAPTVALILVSDGIVIFDTNPSYNTLSSVQYLSVYANKVEVTGPDPGNFMTLSHPSSMDANVIDVLYNLHVLPNADAGSTQRLSLVRGTWQNLSASAN